MTETQRERCAQNPHGDGHCWHWRGTPPTLHTIVQADCCWCGGYATFDYADVVSGRAPRSVSPSGAFHGTAHVTKFGERRP